MAVVSFFHYGRNRIRIVATFIFRHQQVGQVLVTCRLEFFECEPASMTWQGLDESVDFCFGIVEMGARPEAAATYGNDQTMFRL